MRAKRERIKREGKKPVSRENCVRFTKRFVVAGLASAHVVVIHRGQIIVNQRIGVDHLQRAGGIDRVLRVTAAEFAGRHAERGADSLAAGEHTICHALLQNRRALPRTQQFGELRFRPFGILRQAFTQHRSLPPLRHQVA
ncbi:hypothetical protein SDC9_118053 [bioreactor metagenome]|uniref:Uncharacterized protein n=1 Tax=bioreactor metagenome TaxID=1076179 RepID=A0A645BZZ2_9ZZZZ